MKLRPIATILLLLLTASLAAAAALPEYQVKAAFLQNFGKYINWPARSPIEASSTFVIGIIGDDPFGDAFVPFSAKTVKNRPLEIRRLATAKDAGGCHILFISRSEQRRISELLADLNGLNTLTVSDMDDFIRQGGMIQLLLQDKQIRFEVNLRAAKEAELVISSNLLKLATKITE